MAKVIINAANLLSLSRIALAFLFAVLILTNKFYPALIVFLAASMTDLLDGYVARKFSGVTAFGEAIDPLADKILLSTAMAALAYKGLIPAYLCLVVVLRDVAMLSSITMLKLKGRDLDISPALSGKGATFFQIFAIVLALCYTVSAGPILFFSATTLGALCFIASVLTIMSAVEYAFRIPMAEPALGKTLKIRSLRGKGI